MPEIDRAKRGEIIATASTEYRFKRYIMVVLLVGWGLWSVWDGYYAWPKHNEDALKQTPKVEKLPHTSWDILMNRVLGCVLPPAGIAVLVIALRRSRGQYRLRDKILTAPGHPPVPLTAIRSIDKTDWDRKGIAYLNYELPNGMTGSLCLDDFIYQREPTDEIFKAIEEFTGTAEKKTAPETRMKT